MSISIVESGDTGLKAKHSQEGGGRERERNTQKATACEKTCRNLSHWRHSLTAGGGTRTSPWLYCRLSLERKLDLLLLLWGLYLSLGRWWVLSTPLCVYIHSCFVKSKSNFLTLPQGLVVCFESCQGKKSHSLHLSLMVKHTVLTPTRLC